MKIILTALLLSLGLAVNAVEVDPSQVRAEIEVPAKDVVASMFLCTSEERAKVFVESAVLAGKAGWQGEILAIRDSRDPKDMCALLTAKVDVKEILLQGVAPDGVPVAAVRVELGGATLYVPTAGVLFKNASGI